MRLSRKTASLALLVLGCSGDSTSGPTDPLPAVSSVKLSRDTATLVPEATVQITASAMNAAGQTVSRAATWRCWAETAGAATAVELTNIDPATISPTMDLNRKLAISTSPGAAGLIPHLEHPLSSDNT